MERRALSQLLTVFGAGTAISSAAREGIFAGGKNTLGDLLDLDEWERTVHEYGQLLTVRPAGALTKDLAADLLAVGELLKRKMAESERRRMLRVSARLSACLAIDLEAPVTSVPCVPPGPPPSMPPTSPGTPPCACGCAAGWPKRQLDRTPGERHHRFGRRGHRHRKRGAVGGVGPRSRCTRLCRGRPGRRCWSPRLPCGGRADFRAVSWRWWGTNGLRLPGDPFALVKVLRQVLVGDGRARETVARALSLYPAEAQSARSNLTLMDAAALIRAREVEAGLQQALTVVEKHPDAATAARKVLVGQILRTLPEQARQMPAARELRALASPDESF